MKRVCLIWNFHQPYRVGRYQVFDIGNNSSYFGKADEETTNKTILEETAKEVYKPLISALTAFSEADGDPHFGIALSGTLLDQLEHWSPETIGLLKRLIGTGSYEILAQSYYASPAFWYSENDFNRQVKMHRKKISKLFGEKMRVFFNGRFPFTRELAIWADKQKYNALVAYAPSSLLEDLSPWRVYLPQGSRTIDFVVISQDSLTGQKDYSAYLGHLRDVLLAESNEHEIPTVVFDIEELVSKSTSVKEAVVALHIFIDELRSQGVEFVSPFERLAFAPDSKQMFPIPPDYHTASLYEWNINSMQREALTELFALENAVKDTRNAPLIESWRRLQTVEHFLSMDVAGYSEDALKTAMLHESPYDSFIAYMNVIKDIEERTAAILKDTQDKAVITKIPIRIAEEA